MRLLHALLPAAILALAACRSDLSSTQPKSGWQALPEAVPAQWRTLHLYSGTCAFVLASDESQAKQAHDVAEAAQKAFTDVLGRKPSRGLLIAVAAKDPLLIEDPWAMAEAAGRWNAKVTGRDQPPAPDRSLRGDGSDDPEIAGLAARFLCGGIPKDEPTLDLPPGLRDRVAHVVFLPTASCLEATSHALLAAAAERAEAGWFTRHVLFALAGVEEKLAVKMKQHALASLLDVWLRVEAIPPEQADAIVERAGVAGVLRKPSALGSLR